MSVYPELELAAARSRRNVLRMFQATPAGHLGGAMSAIEVLTALYHRIMSIDPANPYDPARDRFLLSAGHKALGQYAVLADRGYFAEAELDTYGKLDTTLGGHPDMHRIPGIEANTGALGHGLAIGTGIALGVRMQGYSSRVFTLLGDGELAEGSNWEGAAIAAHHNLSNLIAIVDVNGFQISGPTAEVLNMEPIADKFLSFGWDVASINGNNLEEVIPALESPTTKPRVVIAHTVKGLGVGSVQGTVAAHYWRPSPTELALAVAEADERIEILRVREPA